MEAVNSKQDYSHEKSHKSSTSHDISSFLRVYGSSNSKTITTVSIFDTPYELIQSIYIPMNILDEMNNKLSSDLSTSSAVDEEKSGNGLSCRRCKVVFQSWEEQRDHFKSDSHILNMKPSFRTLKTIISDPSSSSSSSSAMKGDDMDSVSSSDDGDDDEQVISSSGIGKAPIMTSYGSITWRYDTRLGTQWIYEPRLSSTSSSSSVISSSDVMYNIILSTTLLPKDLSSSIFSSTSLSSSNPWLQLCQTIKSYQESNLWAVILFKSGKFAGGIFEGKTCIMHKVFKRYTVRAKAGGSQSSYDNKHGKAKSAGAMMRRAGEQALKEDIQRLLQEWQEYIASCSLILTSIPKTRRGIFYENESSSYDIITSSSSSSLSSSSLLKKDDERIRSIPFAIDAITNDNVIKVHHIISSLSFTPTIIPTAEVITQPINIISATPEHHLSSSHDHHVVIATSIDRDTSIRSDDSSYIITSKDIPQSSELFRYIHHNNIIEVQNLILSLSTASLYDDSHIPYTTHQLLLIPENEESWMTALHVASMLGYVDIVLLLLHAGADPCKRDIRGRTPVILAKDKITRDVYRKYRGEVETSSSSNADDNDEDDDDIIPSSSYNKNITGPLKAWDWDSAGIGPAITDDVERLKKEKEKEKKKRAKQRKKDDKVREEEAMKILKEEQVKQHQESERRMIEQKKRLEKAAGVCEVCQVSLYASTVYTVFDKRVCSNACVSTIRRKLAAEAAEKRFAK